MDSKTDTRTTPAAVDLSSGDLFGLLRKMLNKHFMMAADEHKENASHSSVMRHAAEFDAAEAEFMAALDEVIADRKRLNWLENNHPILWSLMRQSGEEYWIVTDQPGFTENGGEECKTARAAIDAAMRGPNAGSQTQPPTTNQL